MNATSTPLFRACAILFDMDDTLTGPTGHTSGEDFVSSLVRVVARTHRLSPAEAEARIRSTLDPECETVDAHYDELGITPRQYWDELIVWARMDVAGHPDAVQVVPELHRRGFRLFTATTNGSLACRLKLCAAGLGDETGSPYFERLLGGSEVHPRGKTGPWFFTSLLDRVGLGADQVVMVGDNPLADLQYARDAGYTQIAIVNRDLDADCLPAGRGAVFVRRLTALLDLVALARDGGEQP